MAIAITVKIENRENFTLNLKINNHEVWLLMTLLNHYQ